MESTPGSVLPIEIICRIICFMSPLDVVRLRVVSKQFRELTYDPLIWRTLYSNASLPRQPGPLPSQSTEFLEHTLAQSARLERTWTTHTMKTVGSEQQLELDSPLNGGTPKLVGGRWLISCDLSRRILLHDMLGEADWAPQPVVLWERVRDALFSWDPCSITLRGEVMVYVVLNESRRPGTPGDDPWKMIQIKLNETSRAVDGREVVDIPVRQGYRGDISPIAHDTVFVYLRGPDLIFDTRHRIFYDFPEADLELHPAEEPSARYGVLLTDTYIITLNEHGASTLVQAFVIPTHPTPTTRGSFLLQLTHEGVLHEKFANFFAIKQPRLDVTSKSAVLRFLQLRQAHMDSRSTLQFICADLMLPAAESGVVLPISIRQHALFSVDNAVCKKPSLMYSIRITHSPEGYARGIYIRHGRPTPFSFRTKTSRFLAFKFTIDASPDDCDAVRGFHSPVSKSPDDILFRSPWLWFDGIRGKLYYCGLIMDTWATSYARWMVTVVDVR